MYALFHGLTFIMKPNQLSNAIYLETIKSKERVFSAAQMNQWLRIKISKD
jgi:hypothetical protein